MKPAYHKSDWSIDLIEQEIQLHNVAFMSINTSDEHDLISSVLNAAHDLMVSLLDRDIIPQPRREYFTNADYNIGGRGKSRLNVFEGNGTRGKDIFKHNHFRPHLWYFIHGANLDNKFKSSFKSLVDMTTYSSDVKDECRPAVLNFYKTHQLLKKDFADEMFKLCLDTGLSLYEASNLRNMVMEFRP